MGILDKIKSFGKKKEQESGDQQWERITGAKRSGDRAYEKASGAKLYTKPPAQKESFREKAGRFVDTASKNYTNNTRPMKRYHQKYDPDSGSNVFDMGTSGGGAFDMGMGGDVFSFDMAGGGLFDTSWGEPKHKKRRKNKKSKNGKDIHIHIK